MANEFKNLFSCFNVDDFKESMKEAIEPKAKIFLKDVTDTEIKDISEAKNEKNYYFRDNTTNENSKTYRNKLIELFGIWDSNHLEENKTNKKIGSLDPFNTTKKKYAAEFKLPHKKYRDDIKMCCLVSSSRLCFNYFYNLDKEERFKFGEFESQFNITLRRSDLEYVKKFPKYLSKKSDGAEFKDVTRIVDEPDIEEDDINTKPHLDFYYEKDGCRHFIECKCKETFDDKDDFPISYKYLLNHYFGINSKKTKGLVCYEKITDEGTDKEKHSYYYSLRYKHLKIKPPIDSGFKEDDRITKCPIDIKQMLCHLFAIQERRRKDENERTDINSYSLDYYFFLNNEYSINGYQYTIKTWFDAVVKGLKKTKILKNANGEYCIDLNINFVCIDEKEEKSGEYKYKYI